MIVRFSPRPEDLQRLQVGPIGPHLPGFANLVAQQGYCSVRERSRMKPAATFSELLQGFFTDRTLLLVALQTGVRVSELIGLRCQDVALETGAHVRCTGKGRKTRCMYLHANIELKEKALAKTEPFRGRLRRYRPPDHNDKF